MNPGTLNPRTLAVGLQLPPLRLPPISRDLLARFADASGDRNPIHLDPAVAHAAGFPDVFAHGMLSMAYLGRLLTSWVPQATLRSFGVRFAATTPLHAAPVCTGSVRAIDDTPSGRLVTVDLAVTLADGTVTLRGDATIAVDPTAVDPTED